MGSLSEEGRRANRGPAAAAENRRALIAAAREVYATNGLAAPLSAVARRAGVGQGSLYRHFDDRTDLAVAVFQENLADLESYTLPIERTVDDLLDRVTQQAMVATAFIELITADLRNPRVAELGTRFRAVAERLVEREREAGRIGDHIDADDVVMAAGMLATEVARTDPERRAEAAERARTLFRAAFVPRHGPQ